MRTTAHVVLRQSTMLSLALLLIAAPDFPSDVVIPTPTEAAGIEQLYAVRDGKLWTKRDDKSWELFAGQPTGRPIIAVFADERDHLTVVTDDGLMHHHENGAWDSQWGLPTLPLGLGRAPLGLPFAVDKLRAGQLAYSMRHANVLYYEDTRGQQFHWGDVGCTSLYALDDVDNTRILYADPWVPADWSREVCGPERGGVRIAALAASASTIFVIAVNGELFTRFDDYDHNGGTPLFHYRYGEYERQDRPGTELSSSSQIRALPGDDWRAQPKLPEGARASRRIAIVQNGQGNAARELRVIGANADGTIGVFTKQLNDAAWKFKATEAALNASDWIDPSTMARTPPRAITYAGRLRGPKSLGHVVARTDDFWFHCSPFTLALTLDGEEVRLVAHAVDAWTVFAQENPVDDPSAPKLLKLTFELPKDAKLSPRARARLDQIFAGNIGKTFAFVGYANQHELVIAPLGYPLTGARSRWELVLRSDPRDEGRALARIHPARDVAKQHPNDPCKALDAVRAQRSDMERRLALFSTLEVTLPGGTAVADAATIVTTARYTLELIKWLTAFELHVPAVLAAPSLAYSRWLESSRADFERVERELREECRGGLHGRP